MREIKCILKKSGGVLEEKGAVYAKTIDARRIKGEDLVEMMARNCSVSASQVRAVLSALAETTADIMSAGHSVEILYLGSLSLDVRGKVVKSRAGNLLVKEPKWRLKFKPHRSLQEQFNGLNFKPLSNRVLGNTSLTPERAAQLATRLAQSKGFLCSSDFAAEAECSKSYAARQLKALEAQGTLESHRQGRMLIYRLT
jgi:nucleoid DNA-binding protein